MATLAPFGLAPSQRHVGQTREYIIRSTDTLAYGIGDPVKSTNVIFQGRLPDGRPTQGIPGVTKAASGDRIRGVIVGMAPAQIGSDSMSVPATKARDYVVLVNDDPRTVYEIQANNTSALGALAGSYANFVVASPAGSVSGMYLDSTSFNTTAGDCRVLSVDENQGANSVLRVVFAFHEDTQTLTAAEAVSAHSLALVAGVVPATRDYAGVMNAILSALEGPKIVLFEDAVYDLGDNYIPVVGGLSYLGIPTRLDYNANGWTGRNREIAGGTRFATTHQYTFWDGAVDQAAITTTVAAQACTTTAGSTSIAVPDSGLFTVGGRVYVAADANGFYQGVAYFCLSAAANVITLSLANMVAIAATATGAITVGAGTPMDGTSRLTMRNLAGVDVKTFIKMGAINTFACHYSEISDIFVNGTKTYPAWDIQNYNQSNFRNMSAKECDGAYFRVNYPVGSFMPGNSTHWRPLLVRSNLTESNDNYKQRGLIWEAADGSLMNEEHIYFPESFSAYASVRADAAAALVNGSANVTVADAALWPIDLPVWIAAGGNPGGFLTNSVYFVVASSGTQVQLSAKKRGTAVTSNASVGITLRSWGYPNMEMVAYGTGNIGSSTLQAMDLEGNCTMHLLLQRATTDILSTGQCPAAEAFTGVVGRGYNGIFKAWDFQTTDIDYSSAVHYYGQRTTAVSGTQGGVGLWYDNSLGGSGVGGFALNLHSQHQQSTPTIVAASTGSTYFLKPGQAFGHRMRSQDTTTSLVGTGDYVFNGAAGQTLTLPTMQDTNAVNTLLGAPFGVINASANNVDVSTAGGQLLNGQAGKTSMTLTPGQWARYFGAKTAGGTMIVGVFTNGTI